MKPVCEQSKLISSRTRSARPGPPLDSQEAAPPGTAAPGSPPHPDKPAAPQPLGQQGLKKCPLLLPRGVKKSPVQGKWLPQCPKQWRQSRGERLVLLKYVVTQHLCSKWGPSLKVSFGYASDLEISFFPNQITPFGDFFVFPLSCLFVYLFIYYLDC